MRAVTQALHAPFACRTLGRADFETAFGEPVSDHVAREIAKTPLLYRYMGQDERDGWIGIILDVIVNDKHHHAGADRLPVWEQGWSEHLAAIEEPLDPAALTPRYFGKHPVVRWDGDLAAPISPGFEYRCFEILQHWLFDRYFRDASAILEFGCGTGHNLVRAHAVNRSAWICGLDWSQTSQTIMHRIEGSAFEGRSSAERFDFFQPRAVWRMDRRDVVFTAAALEQVGTQFKPFVEFLLHQRPGLCVHMEPVNELLDDSKLLDALSIRYARRRNYLDGFLTYLRELEQAGLITIHLARRTGIGSLFLEGYSVVAWSPR